MDEDMEIDVYEQEIKSQSDAQLPVNFITVGEVDPNSLKIYIKQDIYNKIEKFSSTDTKREVGSILIGDYVEELGKVHVVISDYIEAKYTDASETTLTFTHETWGYIYSEHERLFPNKKIVGWQHTHPNYGIFLSNYDIFIQENFFNLPFQTAYVVDPIQNIRGFFENKNGKVEKLKGYYIYDDIGKEIKIKKSNKTNIKSSNKLLNVFVAVMCLLLMLTSVLAFSMISLRNELKMQGKEYDVLENKLTLQEKKIEEQSATIVSGQNDIESQKKTVENHEALIKDIKSLINTSSDESDIVDNTIYFKQYTIKFGDSLISICNENKLDFSENVHIICSINGITNPNLIEVGQTILIPKLFLK